MGQPQSTQDCASRRELGNKRFTIYQRGVKPEGTGKPQLRLLHDYRQTPHDDREKATAPERNMSSSPARSWPFLSPAKVSSV